MSVPNQQHTTILELNEEFERDGLKVGDRIERVSILTGVDSLDVTTILAEELLSKSESGQETLRNVQIRLIENGVFDSDGLY